MRTEVVTVTPQTARSWLSSSNLLNRKVRHRLVSRYASDMRSGAWVTSHQGIAFYEDGTLADGQHRLAAVVRANVTVDMLVTFDLPKSSAIGIDQHAQRKTEDSLRLGGAPAWITKDEIAVVRWMASQGHGSVQLSPNQVEAYAAKFETEIRFATDITSRHKRNITCAGIGCQYVLAVLAGEEKSVIRRFAEIMYSGEISAREENAAVRLREYALQNSNCWNGTDRAMTAKRAQRAIQAFCAHQPLDKLYQPADWIYPFPAISSVLPGFDRIHNDGIERLLRALKIQHQEFAQ